MADTDAEPRTSPLPSIPSSPAPLPEASQLDASQPALSSEPLMNSSTANGGAPQTPHNPNLNSIPLLNDDGTSKRPRDARLLHLVLSNQGIKSYEPRTVLQLMDFSYRYTSQLLSDAHTFTQDVMANSASNRNSGKEADIGMQAVRLAASTQPMNRTTKGLGKEFWLEEARRVNAVPLPAMEEDGGIGGVRLPPPQYCVTGTEWSIMSQMVDGPEDVNGLEEPVLMNGHLTAEEIEDEDMEDIEGNRMEDLFGDEPVNGFDGGGGGDHLMEEL